VGREKKTRGDGGEADPKARPREKDPVEPKGKRKKGHVLNHHLMKGKWLIISKIPPEQPERGEGKIRMHTRNEKRCIPTSKTVT